MTDGRLPSIDWAVDEIREALVRVPGLSLVRVAEALVSDIQHRTQKTQR